jgi:hypothetical protein
MRSNSLGASVLVTLLAGCGGSQPPIGVGDAVPQTGGLPSGHVGYNLIRSGADAKTTDAWLYVTGNSNNEVAVYDLSKSGFPLVGTITDGISSPGGVAVDKNGQVYVANETGTVTIYPSGEKTPSLTLSSGLESPQSVTVDAYGNVYVCNRGTYPDIVVFPPAKSTPSQVITNNLIQAPTQIQFDKAGDLYYTDSNTGVSEIASGSQNMVDLDLKGLERTDGIALDHYGNLYVGTFGSGLDGAREYLPGDQGPVRTLRDAKGSDLYASGVVRREQYIFLPESYDNTVKAFKPNRTRPEFVINAPEAQYSVGVAVKSAGIP